MAWYNSGGQPLIVNCVFSGNVVSWSGGGLYNQGGAEELVNCVFSDNSCTDGGGGGGGIRQASGTLTLTNCTVSGNHCSWGGGLWFHGDTTLNNCIFWGNTGGYVSQIGGNTADLWVYYCDVEGGEAGILLSDGQLTWEKQSVA